MNIYRYFNMQRVVENIPLPKQPEEKVVNQW